MSDPSNNQSLRKSIFGVLTMPVRFAYDAVSQASDGIKQIGSMFASIFRRGRRNQNFEKSGRESQKVVRRHVSVTAFRKGEQERSREVMEAERESRKLLSSNSKQAVEYREQLKQRKVEYSRGAAVNHLAMVNERHRKAGASGEKRESLEKKPK